MKHPLIALVRCLSFSADRTADVSRFSETEWERTLLPLCDRAHLTLPIGVRAAQHLPPKARRRIEGNLMDNAARHQQALDSYQELAAAFAAHGVQYLVLKGFSQQPDYCAHLNHRPQYDLDFFSPPDSMEAAWAAAIGLGYEPFRKTTSPMDLLVDHMPALIRKTGWRPGTDYFDPKMPFTVELHHRLWDHETERFHIVPTDSMWSRRVMERCRDLEFPALSREDRYSYSACHLVRHLLRGDLRPYHVYEIAHFLHSTAGHDSWWARWKRSVDGQESSLHIAAIASRLARDWFECRLHPEVEHLIQLLPPKVDCWFDTFGDSPLTAWQQPNKNELFLHLSLVTTFHDRVSVLRRRMIPVRFQPPVLDAHAPRAAPSLVWKRRLFGSWFMMKRSIYHLRALWPVAVSAVRWRRALSRTPRQQSPRKLRVESAAQ
jgi:hypothetical protein